MEREREGKASRSFSERREGFLSEKVLRKVFRDGFPFENGFLGREENSSRRRRARDSPMGGFPARGRR